jgi:hypothetical protein
MALIYEHWRPDTNECFYVGASRIGEKRANNFSYRNSLYESVIGYLTEIGMKPFYKIIWEGIPDDCISAYEKIRISYQKSVLGSKLTNQARGGDGFNVDWTVEKRTEMSLKITKINNDPERLERNRETQKIAQSRPDVVAKKSKSAKIVMNLPEIKEKNRQGQFRANSIPGLLEKRGAKIREGHMKRPFEERSAVAKQRQAARTPEQKTASAKKGAETKRRKRAENSVKEDT